MSTFWYGATAQKIAGKQIDLVNDEVKVMLVSSAYSPNVDSHAVKSDVTNEISGTGYTAGGAVLSGKTFTQNTADNKWTWDANDTTFAASTLTFRYAVLYDNTASGQPLIGYVDFGSNQSSTNQDLTIKWEYQYQDELTGDIITVPGILTMGY